MNKKKIAAVVGAGVLIVLFLLLPGFLGDTIEKNVRQSISDLPERINYSQNIFNSEIYGWGLQWKAEVKNYQKGWFTSQASVEFSLDASNLDPKLIQGLKEKLNWSFLVDFNIYHGPLTLAKGVPKFGLAALDGKTSFPLSMQDYFHSEDVLHFEFSGLLGLFGSANFSIVIPEQTVKVIFLKLGNFSISFTGGESVFFLETNLETLKTETQIPKLILVYDMGIGNMTMHLEGYKEKGKYETNSANNLEYNRKINIKKFGFSLNYMTMFNVQVVGNEYKSEEKLEAKDGVVNYASTSSQGPIKFGGDEFQDPQLVEAKISTRFLNINLKALEPFFDLSNLESRKVDNNQVLEMFVTTRPELNIDEFYLKTIWGDLNYNQTLVAWLSEKNEDPPTDQPKGDLLYSGTFRLDESFVKEALKTFVTYRLLFTQGMQGLGHQQPETISNQLYDEFIQQGIILKEGEKAVIRLEYKNRRLFINGIDKGEFLPLQELFENVQKNLKQETSS